MLSQDDINYLIDLAYAAGEKILEFYKKQLDISYKGDNSPVTQADLVANNIIIAGLKKFTWPIISEESYSSSETENYPTYWLVDPLDGTKEFISHNDEFTVNIALISKRSPVFGIVYAPALNEGWLGINGITHNKAYKIKNKSQVMEEISCRKGNLEALTSLISKNHADKNRLNNFYRENNLNITTEISAGSSLKICYIAEGKADIYPRLGPTKEWDIAAAQAVLESAGGYIISPGGRLEYGKKDLLNPYFVAANLKNNFRFPNE